MQTQIEQVHRAQNTLMLAITSVAPNLTLAEPFACHKAPKFT